MGVHPNINLVTACKRMFHNLQVYDLGFKSHLYTWKHGSLLERLERAFVKAPWCNVFPFSAIHHLSFVGTSDHWPILLVVPDHRPRNKSYIGRKFERWWSHLEGYKEHLFSSWTSDLNHRASWQRQCQEFLKGLHGWSQSHPENFKTKINSLWTQLELAQSAMIFSLSKISKINWTKH